MNENISFKPPSERQKQKYREVWLKNRENIMQHLHGMNAVRVWVGITGTGDQANFSVMYPGNKVIAYDHNRQVRDPKPFTSSNTVEIIPATGALRLI